MSQATRRRVSSLPRRSSDSTILPFHDILDATMVKEALTEERGTFSARVSAPLVTLSLFLSQVRDPDHSCRGAVARRIIWLAIQGRKTCAPETGSSCDARQRLPLEVVTRLVRRTAQEIESHAADEWLWKGRPVALVDGTTASMPNTPENQRAFPQSAAQGVGLGFPLVRMVAVISLATGVVRDLALGPVHGEGDGRDGAVPHPVGRPQAGRNRGERPVFLLVLRDRGTGATGRRRLVPHAPAAEVRLQPPPPARRRGPRSYLGQAGAARMDGRRDLGSEARRIDDARAARRGRAGRLPHQ
jgi:hypothetical protein